MESSGKISYTFRKYPLLRWILGFIIISIVAVVIFFYNVKSKPIPIINSITPPVGSPGDVVVIRGSNFGDVRDMSYVEIAGSKLTNSAYISWEDECIKIVLPANVQDGLVVVGTKDRCSEPVLFANEVDIPVPVPAVKQVTRPVIDSLSSSELKVGEILVIQGNNFGDARNQSKVWFSTSYSDRESTVSAIDIENMIPANVDDFDYVSWSNTEIQVRIPDGAASGPIMIDNGKEQSDPKKISINKSAGSKSFSNKKIYLVQYSVDLQDIISSSDDTTITLRCPVPYTNVAQPRVEVNDVSPTPILMDYQKNLIHQLTKLRSGNHKYVYSQTFVLPVYEIKSSVNPDKIGYYKNTDKNFMGTYVRADQLIPSDDEKIIDLAGEIVGREKNPYRKAKKIYNYICENFAVTEELRKSDKSPLDLLDKKVGDAYDFAVIYTTLLRASGIPAVTNSGILVSQDLSTQPHWWCEFYVDKVGWIPVDPALGAGMEYNKWTDTVIEDENEYYFGNMDSHHIIFSRGWKQLKPFSADNKIVQQPKSFGLQSIWEEASSSVMKYSSYWSVPVVKGVY